MTGRWAAPFCLPYPCSSLLAAPKHLPTYSMNSSRASTSAPGLIEIGGNKVTNEREERDVKGQALESLLIDTGEALCAPSSQIIPDLNGFEEHVVKIEDQGAPSLLERASASNKK